MTVTLPNVQCRTVDLSNWLSLGILFTLTLEMVASSLMRVLGMVGSSVRAQHDHTHTQHQASPKRQLLYTAHTH